MDDRRNAEEIAYWNEEAGLRWVRLQDRIDRAFAPLTTALYAAAQAKPGDAVLDIGCGCGATSIALAHEVAPDGSVTGVDISKPMLARAAERAQHSTAHNTRFELGDASIYRFESSSYDLVASRFGVMFFDDPLAAFKNIRTAVSPSGRLAFMCWRTLAENPWFSVPLYAARALAGPRPKADPEAPGPLAFADADRVRGILEAAGFANVGFEKFDARLQFSSPGMRAEAADFLTQIGPTAVLVSEADADTQTAMIAAVDDALCDHETREGVFLGAGVWLVTASAS